VKIISYYFFQEQGN